MLGEAGRSQGEAGPVARKRTGTQWGLGVGLGGAKSQAPHLAFPAGSHWSRCVPPLRVPPTGCPCRSLATVLLP